MRLGYVLSGLADTKTGAIPTGAEENQCVLCVCVCECVFFDSIFVEYVSELNNFVQNSCFYSDLNDGECVFKLMIR